MKSIPEGLLPDEILAKASLGGNEYAWRLADVEETVEAARSAGLLSIGGQVQFRMPDGTCELYWLAADPTSARASETWDEWVNRSADEVIAKFRELRANTDFVAEGMKSFDLLKSKAAEGVVLADHLWFVLYFDAKRK